MRPSEHGYHFILNELMDREITWCPYQGVPDDELAAVREGAHLFVRDMWLHAPQIVVRLVVSRVACQFGSHQVVLPPETVMSHSYRGWAEAISGHSHPHLPEIDDWDRGGQMRAFGADKEASGDYERCWKDITHRYILPESYSGGSSFSIRNCTKAMETLMLLWMASPAKAERRGTHSLGDDLGKEAMMVGLRASLTAKEDELKLRDVVINALADTYERDRDLAASETMRIKLESDLQAEVDRLRASEAEESEPDRAFAERAASVAQIEELSAKLKSIKASVQSSAIVASAPPPLSLGKEKALIHEEYARHMDRMQLSHDEVVADLRRRLERYCQRAEERDYAFSDSTCAPSRRAPCPSSFASSARHAGSDLLFFD